MARIKSIQIQNFRGIRSLSLAPAGRNLVLLGENGTGKSSVVDALEYFFTGKVEKYTGRADIRDRDCLVNANGGQLRVLLHFEEQPEGISVEYPYREPAAPARLKPFFSKAKTRPFILHRAQLLRFIEARPADRYRVVSDLVGLDEIERIETGWKNQRDQQLSELQRLQSQLHQAEAGLSAHIGLTPASTVDIACAVQGRLAGYSFQEVQELPDLGVIRLAVREKISACYDLPQVEAIRSLQQTLRLVKVDIDLCSQALARLAGARQELLALVEATDQAVFEALLQEGRRVLAAEILTQCPLCEHVLDDPQQLLSRVDARLQQLETLTQSKRACDAARQQVAQIVPALLRDIELIIHGMQNPLLAGLGLTGTESVEADRHSLQAWWSRFSSLPAAQTGHTTALELPGLERLTPALDSLLQRLEDEMTRLSSDPSQKDLLELADFLAQVEQSWEVWQAARTEVTQAQYSFYQVDLVYKHLVEARKEGLDNLLSSLQSEFIRLFNHLHPGEGFEAITLLVSPERRSSIGMESTITGHRPMHPYGNYSEGHLDSLGLCLFLAFIKQWNTGVDLIILDDVLTSIDAGHRMRVARLLAEEFGDYQILLTTHDEMWANELKVVMNSQGLKLLFQRLKPWDSQRGADLDEYSSSPWSFYHQMVDSHHSQDAIAGVGRTLEQFFCTMRRNLGLSIPASRSDLYTLGQLYEPFFKWIHGHPFTREDMPNVTEQIASLKEELDIYWRFRNWSGAHYNTWGATVSESEAKSFIQIVEELVSLFQCPRCSALVVYEMDAHLIHCPVCEPIPRLVHPWLYRPDWRVRAERALEDGILKRDKAAVGITRAACEYFLRDIRWIASLSIPPVEGDRYQVEHLFSPFSSWAVKHIDNQRLLPALEDLARFLNDQCQWLPEVELVQRAKDFYRSVDSVASLFECTHCGSLLRFRDGIYCQQCTGQGMEAMPAHWRVMA